MTFSFTSTRPVSGTPSTDAREVDLLLASPKVQAAFEYLSAHAAATTAEHITINEIPSPPFKERARAEYVREVFGQIGLKDVRIDAEGNVVGVWPGSLDPEGGGPYLALAAHLDSVFPEGTDVRVRRENGRLFAPGIGDNACGLAGMLAVARCLTALNVTPRRSVLFVGSVGEEGDGNLRGVRHLCSESSFSGRIVEFVALDGPGIDRITHQALGSRRYAVTFEGPGGHSWGDFGTVNPIHALSRFIRHLTDYPLPAIPRTTCSVGVIEGGSSVNAIPRSARCEVDLRSVSDTELDRLEANLYLSANIALAEEHNHAAAHSPHLTLTVTPIGNRPSGQTDPAERIVRLAREVTRRLGHQPLLDCSSTDANIPISLRIPAITIGMGGRCGGCHTLDEWYEPTDRETSLKRGLLLVLALAGLAG